MGAHGAGSPITLKINSFRALATANEVDAWPSRRWQSRRSTGPCRRQAVRARVRPCGGVCPRAPQIRNSTPGFARIKNNPDVKGRVTSGSVTWPAKAPSKSDAPVIQNPGFGRMAESVGCLSLRPSYNVRILCSCGACSHRGEARRQSSSSRHQIRKLSMLRARFRSSCAPRSYTCGIIRVP